MSDRHSMPYLTHDECVALGLTPYAVYGGRVYSYKDADGVLQPHGSPQYGRVLEEAAHAMMMRAAVLAGARGC